MKVTRRRDTPGEVAVRTLLHRAGFRYRIDASVLGSRTRADLLFPRSKVAVFWDGCFWHGCPLHGTWPKANAEWWRAKIEGNRRRDQAAVRALHKNGWVVLRFWDHEKPAVAATKIARTIQRRIAKRA